MTPAEYIQRRKAALDPLDWFLELIPSDAGGSDIRRLPPELQAQLPAAGIVPAPPREQTRELLLRYDWVRDSHAALVKKLPRHLKFRLQSSDRLAAGTVNDSEFNGSVIRVTNASGDGAAIIISTGAFLIISFVSELYALVASLNTQIILADGGSKTFDVPNSCWARINRFSRLHHEQLRAKRLLLSGRAADELQILALRYNDLGVADPPDIIGEMGILPLPGHPLRYGHPLEAGSYLANFGRRFLLLHECGHIVLGHLVDQRRSGADLRANELAADRWALEIAVSIAPDDNAAAASILGALVVFGIQEKLEQLAQEDELFGSHPKATVRIRALFDFVGTSPCFNARARKRAARLIAEFADTNRRLDHQSSVLREAAATAGCTLSRFLELCAESGSRVQFEDQLPRWVFQGAPDRLCRSLARERAVAERELLVNPDNTRARNKLSMIMWAFDAARRSESRRVSEFLVDAYNEASSL